MRNARGVLVWLPTLSFLFLATALRTSAQATSTPEERVQWVETTHKLESSPLDDSVNKQGEAAFKRLSDVHDVHVLLCPALLTEFNGMKYAYSHTITRQYMLASGAFQIENPDKMADANQNRRVPREQTGASQRTGPGRHTPPMPNTMPESESNPPQR